VRGGAYKEMEPSPEFALLKAGCDFAAGKLGADAALALLDQVGIPREVIGRVTSKTAARAVCSSPLGEVEAPARAFAAFREVDVGSSWHLTVLPLEATGWRAVGAVANEGGWECSRQRTRAR
jgi:hypothetical protein